MSVYFTAFTSCIRPIFSVVMALVFMSVPPPACAVEQPPVTSAQNRPGVRPKIGLVLSGGGARGFAHVGVLKALEVARVPIDVVVGTSMGAIVGGLYATGMSPEALERELMAIDWNGLFDGRGPRENLWQRRKEEDFEFSPVLQVGFRDGEFRLPTGAVSTRSLEWLLRRYTMSSRNLTNFDALPTPYRAVATDMETGQPVILSEGDLAGALRASMSVPGVFAPLELDGRILGDGGLVNNLPVDVARAMGADVVIAVNIGTPLGARESLGSLLGITSQMINILTEQNVQRSIASLLRTDLLLTPSLGKFTSGDFNSARDIAHMGEAYAQTVMESLKRFSVNESEYKNWQLARMPVADPQPANLAFVRFEGVSQTRAQHLQKLVETTAGRPLDNTRIDSDLRQLSATGDYDRVDYRLAVDPTSRSEGLVFDLAENKWGPNYFRLGLDMRTDFRGEGVFNLRINHDRHWFTEDGTEWRNRLELGDNLALRTELYHPIGGERDRFVSVYASSESRRVELFGKTGDAVALFRRHSLTTGVDHGWSVGRAGHLGDVRLGGFLTRNQSTLELEQNSGNNSNPNVRWNEQGLRASMVSDQLDYANFPQKGHRFTLEMNAGKRDTEGVHQNFTRIELNATKAITEGLHTLNLHMKLARASDIAAGAIDDYSLGGFHNLSGYKIGQVAGNVLTFIRLGYYRKMSMSPGLARALFVGGTFEAGNAWRDAGSIRLKDLRTGGSFYLGADTAAGPVYLSLVHARGGSTGLYLFIGRP